jgi:hypothetical protein
MLLTNQKTINYEKTYIKIAGNHSFDFWWCKDTSAIELFATKNQL